MRQRFSLIAILLGMILGLAQTQITGKATDNYQQPLPNAMVMLLNNNKILEHTQTNKDGNFSFLKSYETGIYNLEISKLGYQKETRQIVIGTDNAKKLDIKINLRPKETELKEVVITAVNPIIVKKDTIIYDIEHFTEQHHESLEEVLAKIQGFKILPDGNIEVEGKVVKKVLVDGKEISDFGAGMITKSLTPDKVKNVEVRFDEKDKKLRESLLDGENFVVLDISLKDNVKKSIFGKQRLTTGYQNKAKLGGLTNIFSLNPKVNIQFFAENNNFGENEIELFMIKNLGNEAFAKFFTHPVDIDDIKSRSNFHNEMYGFKNYLSNDNAIAGLSINVPLSKKTDLYFGSFNNYLFGRNRVLQQSFFDNQLIYNFQEDNFAREYNSKNKIQIKHTGEKWKLTSDVNFVHTDISVVNDIVNNYDNRFNKKQISNNWYFNNHFEYIITKKLGLFASASLAQEQFGLNTKLTTNNTNALDFLGIAEDFHQRNYTTQTMANAKSGLTYRTEKWGTHSLGYRFHSNKIENEKVSNAQSFNAHKKNYYSNTHAIFYDNTLYLGDLFLKTDLGYSLIEFPHQNTQESKGYFQYNVKADYKINPTLNTKIEASHQVDAFPLTKTIFGNTLTDFQTIYLTKQNISPFYNTIYEVSTTQKLGNQSSIWVVYAWSISRNLNNQYFNNDFIFNEANQLKSNLHLFTTIYEGRIRSLNLKYILEPEFIINTAEYLYHNNLEHTTSYRYLAGLKLFYTPKNKRFKVYYYPKYSHFVFENTTKSGKNNFNFLSNKLTLNTYFLEQKLSTELGYRQVNFFQNKDNFNNLDFKLAYKNDKYKWFLEIENLLNSKNFIIEDYNQSLLNVSQNAVFRRFINLGFEMKIN